MSEQRRLSGGKKLSQLKFDNFTRKIMQHLITKLYNVFGCSNLHGFIKINNFKNCAQYTMYKVNDNNY